MDQPALDRRLGTVGANPPCCFRTATHLVTHYHRYSRKRRRQAASSDIPQIKEAGCAHCCFFTPQPHRPKTRHQKWPSETKSRNDTFVARSGETGPNTTNGPYPRGFREVKMRWPLLPVTTRPVRMITASSADRPQINRSKNKTHE